MAAVAACWGSMLALRFKSQSAAPLMQAGMLALILTTTAYAPLALLQGWLHDGRRSQPRDPGARSGAAGLRRQRHLGRHLAGAAGAGRAAGAARRARPARDAPHGRLSRRRAVAERRGRARPARGTGSRASATACRFAYTRPSPARYPWQWYWDSCFAAIVWRRFDPERARAELESLLAAAAPRRLHRPHDLLGPAGLARPRLLFYNVASRSALQTETIQPPLLAWAWRIAVGDPARGAADRAPSTTGSPRNRDLEGDGLLWIVQPDESGLDASPKFDPVWGWRAQRAGSASRCWSRRNRRLGFDARRDPRRAAARSSARSLVNTMWSLSLQAAGPALDHAGAGRAALGRASAGSSSTRRSPAAPRPAVDHLGGAGAARPARPARGDRPAPGRGAPAEPEREFLTPVAPPSVAASEPSYEPGGGRGPIRRYWRGPTWVNSAWMVWLGLRRLGYEEEAERLAAAARSAPSPAKACASTTTRARATASAPRTSPGRALVAELADPDPASATSHV